MQFAYNLGIAMALPLWVVVRFWGCYCMQRATDIAWYTVSARDMLPTDIVVIVILVTFI